MTWNNLDWARNIEMPNSEQETTWNDLKYLRASRKRRQTTSIFLSKNEWNINFHYQ